MRDEQLRSRFERRVLPYIEAQREQAGNGQSWPPVLVYTGGQPGAGKSRANERAAQERRHLVPVIGDDLRQFHPDYARLMREDPLAMPEATAHASGRWLGMAADYLKEQHADVLIETTLRSPEAMAKTIAGFREAGYVVELRVVAVPHEVSRLATVERYTGQVSAVGAGRWTPSAAHDEAFAQAPGTVRDLIAAGAVDRFVIEDRGGGVLVDRSYFGIRDDGLQRSGRDAMQEFARLRGIEQVTPDDAQRWLDRAQEQSLIVKALGEKDPDLSATMERVRNADTAAVVQRVHSGQRGAAALNPSSRGPRASPEVNLPRSTPPEASASRRIDRSGDRRMPGAERYQGSGREHRPKGNTSRGIER